ncbi:leucine-rich repeat protein [Flavivirga eckloniae]|uniref:Cell surface protein n=1 Tax=Flavivirga eckloniae TaxID=1803846 RepID=A0A2K9PTV8_9FLAO|nr:leucine-rich repeat protein [Flavivirga eckloniae]AUP80493.1 cell surface protein [Flavivirga eckloniae]
MNKTLLFLSALFFYGTVSYGQGIGDTFTFEGINYIIRNLDPARVVEVGENRAFKGKADIPAMVTFEGTQFQVSSIGNRAFYTCIGLTSVTIPTSVTSIGQSAFYSCISLTSVDIPNSVTSIENYAFFSCIGLRSIDIPNSVTSVGFQAFSFCTGLTSVTIPGSVTSIENYVFRDCTGLTKVSIDQKAPLTITANIFQGVELSKVELQVPVGSVSAYQAADVWKGFSPIKEIATLGVDDKQKNEPVLNIYPNPNTGVLNIKAQAPGSFQIINALGQVVKTFNVGPNGFNKIDLGILDNGLYLVKETKGTLSGAKKLLVKR